MTAQEPQRTWRPNSAPQEQFLTYGGFEGGYGGAAGGGKSEALLVDALYGIEHSSYRAILFRRTFDELKKSLIDRARDFYPHLGGVEHKTDHVWTFPGGAQVGFSHMAELTDYKRFDSAEFQFVGFDELTSFHREQYIFMASRLRSSKGLRSRLRWATNPGGVGHSWYRTRFVLPFVNKAELETRFVPARVTDNRWNNPEYVRVLQGLSGWQKRAWRFGDWDIAAGQYFTTFRRDVHVIEEFNDVRAVEWFAALDYGFNHYTVVLLGCTDSDGNPTIATLGSRRKKSTSTVTFRPSTPRSVAPYT